MRERERERERERVERKAVYGQAREEKGLQFNLLNGWRRGYTRMQGKLKRFFLIRWCMRQCIHCTFTGSLLLSVSFTGASSTPLLESHTHTHKSFTWSIDLYLSCLTVVKVCDWLSISFLAFSLTHTSWAEISVPSPTTIKCISIYFFSLLPRYTRQAEWASKRVKKFAFTFEYRVEHIRIHCKLVQRANMPWRRCRCSSHFQSKKSPFSHEAKYVKQVGEEKGRRVSRWR